MPLTPLGAIREQYICNDIIASVPLELLAYANKTGFLLIY